MHKPGRFYRILGTLHMSKLYYMHFTYHHLYRHHVEVATPSDPSSSKKGENVYSFIKRCIIHSWIGVYQDEIKKGKKIYENTGILSIVGTVMFMSLVYLIFGLQPLIFHSIAAIGSIIYLEGINYIEHYGLSRKLLPNGEY
jgi:alkane 1-monooxygenase